MTGFDRSLPRAAEGGVAVGIDLGTTDTKAILTDLAGRTVGFARRRTAWSERRGGGTETTGAALVAGALAAVSSALAQLRHRTGSGVRVTGLGITGLAESGVVLDRQGRETSPVIAWFDDRGGAQMAALDPAFRARFPGRTGLAPGPQSTLPKLLWLRADGLELGAGARWLNVPEFVAWRLCGEQVSEPSLASRTGLLDQSSGTPWDEALAILGVGRDFLPPTVPAGTPAGRVARCAAVPDLAGAAVTVAGHDHPVAAVGADAAGAQDLFDSCGTAEVLLRSFPGVPGDAERAALVGLGIDVGRHVLPGRSALIGGMRSGLVMRRVLALLGADDPARRDDLDRRWRAGGRTAGFELIGSGQHDDGVAVRLDDGATPDVAWASTLARLAEQTSVLLAGITSVVGEHRSAVAAGGWTRMSSVRASKAAVIPNLTFSPVGEPGARGAALFGACAASPGSSIEEFTGHFAAAARTTGGPRPDRAALPDQSEREHAHR